MSKKTIEETYKKLTQREHILLRSDTYIGDIKKHLEEHWIFNPEEQKIVKKPVEYSPGFIKIFDEILTNATDHASRDLTVKSIKVDIDETSGEITVWNDGSGIPVVEHKEHKLYVPELIFGHLLTGSNYDDTQSRTGAGRNGYGSKLTGIYSKKFIVETLDSENHLKFYQEFSDNMNEKTNAKITKNSGKSYTKISFIPDYDRFGMKGLEKDILLMLYKRVYDCIACTNNTVQVYLNGERLKGKGLMDYTKYFFEDGKIFHETFTQKIKGVEYVWEWAVAPSTNGFEQVSFVNGNATNQGGKHVDYILYQIVNRLKKMLEEKKKLKDIKPNMIKDKLFLFLRATVANPSFNSQTKEQLTTQSKDFGCSPDVTEGFITKLYKSSITDELVSLYKIKEQMDLVKATDGTKRTRIFIDKLDDATWAGSNRSHECSLFVTEGLSASTFAKWGRNVMGNERFGVFPLKGKILNVRDASVQQLINNEEINNIKQILGLKQNVEYTKESIKNLRYGNLIILTDADVDGAHISSLIVNLFHYWWPSLLKLNYVKKMITPIIKVKDARTVKEFFTQQDLEKFLENNTNKNLKFSYYKGLGTWEKNDCQELFKNGRFTELLKQYCHRDSDCDNHIKLAFEKENTKGEQTWSDKRKDWLSTYDKKRYIPKEQKEISLKDMVNKELIHFSVYDNSRSIPSYIDGLKPSQRKILHYMLKRNITENIKVAQLSGYVSAETSYHHGEVSLQKAIVCMAQNFIGSNNVNLLYPSGNFGTRPFGGADASSARYIFTRLERLTKIIFNDKDSELLNYLEDDGQTVEPEYFLPIIPIILVNGCEGIGTGYSTFIPSFSPLQIIDNLLYIIEKRGDVDSSSELTELVPYYKNFKGEIIKDDKPNSWRVNGKWRRAGDKTVVVTELPVNVVNYATYLQNKIKKDGVIKDYIDESTDENLNISIKIEFAKSQDLDKLIETGDILKELKLTSTLSTNNMYVFDEELKLNKYSNPNDLLLDFYDFRIDFYEKRRQLILKNLKYEHLIYSNKVRFIKEYISGHLDINRKTKDYVIELLTKNKYDKIDNGYEYLYNMPIITLTLERVDELNNKVKALLNEIDVYNKKTHLDLWREELLQLRSTLTKN